MWVAYASHSLVDNRQARFAQTLRTQLADKGANLHEVHPTKWANLTRPDGYEVTMTHGGAQTYNFTDQAWRDLEALDPDVLLLQNEPYSFIATVASRWCQEHDTKLILFTWENQHPFEEVGNATTVLESADYVICGNPTAQHFIQDAGLEQTPPNRVLPQVGVDVDHFHPKPEVEEEWDVYVTGRPDDPMKAVDDALEATQGMDWDVVTRRDLPHVPHDALPTRYNKARVVARPSKDVPGRPREQYLPSSTAEAVACGTPVVTSDQDAVWYWGVERWDEACPAIFHHEEGNIKQLQTYLADWLSMGEEKRRARGLEGREWLEPRLSNEVIASAYVKIFQEVVE